jgi:hypothetical protein
MKGFYLIALVLLIGIVVFGMLVAMGPEYITKYGDIPSFVILLLPVLLLLKSQFSWNEIGMSFVIGFRRKSDNVSELKKALLFFKAMQKYLIWAGVFGVMLGNIALFNFISIGYEAFGSGIATSLLVLFYAIILIFTVALPFQFGIKKKLIEAGEKDL